MRPSAMLVIAAAGAIARAEPVDGPYWYDTLNFADTQSYDAGNGDAYSGIGAFGALYDLMLADDFRTTHQNIISVVTADYVTFFGGTPANGLQVDILQDLGGVPGAVIASQTAAVSSATSWTDTLFGLAGRRLTAYLYIPLAANTSYYIMIQPIDLTSGGDWYYQIRDLDSRIGGDACMRDGGRANGGYGFSNWISAGNSGFGAGDVGMAIGIPAPSSPVAFALAGLGALRRRRTS